MIANYTIIDDISLLELKKIKNSNEIADKIDDFCNDDENFPVCDIDKIWNALYYTLTGKISPTSDKENFTEYARGVFVFGDELLDQDLYITYIKNNLLKEILPEIEKINFSDLYNSFNVANLIKDDVYPSHWNEDEKDLIFEEIEMAFEEMKALFKNALKSGKNILVTIY